MIFLQIVSWIFSLVALACFIFVVVKMFQHGKTGPAIGSLVGLLACGLGALFAFIYGWTKAGEWRITNVMIAWSLAIVINLGASFATLPAQLEAMRIQMEQQQGGNFDASPPVIVPGPDVVPDADAPVEPGAPTPTPAIP